MSGSVARDAPAPSALTAAPAVIGLLAATGGGGDRAAAIALAVVCVAAAAMEVVSLARRRVADRLLVVWAGIAVCGALAWFVVAVSPSALEVSIVAVIATGLGPFLLGAATVWARLPIWTLATTRVLVDVAAVGSAGAGLWVLARVPPRLSDGTVAGDRTALVVVGVLAAPTLAYAVVGGSRGETGLLRIGAALSGAAALVWADDRLRGGSVPVVWTAAFACAVVVNVVLFRVTLRRRLVDRSGRGLPPPATGRARTWTDEVGVTAIEPSPMIAGVVESVLWVLIVIFQIHRPIELAVAITACVAAAAISLRSMSRWLDQTRVISSLQQMANTDPLTSLPNRRGFARAMAECRPGALALIDLDGFKGVNDRLGHAAGDRLLGAVADAGRRHLPERATLARLGGDEFGLVVPGNADDGVRAAEELVDAIAGLRLAGHVTASAGVAEVSPDIEATLRNAGFALHWAKRAGRGRTMRLSEQMVDLELRRSQLAEALAADIELDRLYVVYQPVVRIADGCVVGAEALARWRNPVHGEVPAEEFIPIAEERGLIDRIGELVLDRVIAEIVHWESAGVLADVAVNMSGLQLRGSEIARRYADRVAAGGVRGRVSIEVTESAIVDDESLETLDLLRASGFRIAIDDFGTGYASISRFMRMRPDRLKVDRRFVRDLGTPAGATSAVLVEAVVGIAHQFGVEVVAEGVESEAALTMLASIGCDYAQGFFCGRPGPAADFLRAVGVRQPSSPLGR